MHIAKKNTYSLEFHGVIREVLIVLVWVCGEGQILNVSSRRFEASFFLFGFVKT
jgi:hypothetical protein